ncbi:MAG: trypsin-like serine protease [Myxococcota bacterium]
MSVITPVALSSALMTLAAAGAGPQGLVGSGGPSDPTAIVGGNMAEPCQWPSVVAMLEDDDTPVMCSGTLVHPDVIMTAAHCIIPERPIIAVGFGEAGGNAGGAPSRVVSVVDCIGNPEYYEGEGADVGYCLLDSPVLDVPIVPLMEGCEVEALVPGSEIVIIGFGATYGSYDPETDSVNAVGVGPKRWTTQTVHSIDEFVQEINMHGDNGSQSACFGDSGGPAMVALADGSWRVFGTGGHLFDPGGLPPPKLEDNVCGSGAAYGFAPFVIDWLEAETGVDLTPCWDGGVWAPNADCGNFPLDPDIGQGSWASGCSGGSFGGGVAPTCDAEPPPPEPPGTTGGSDDFGESTDGFEDDGFPGSTSLDSGPLDTGGEGRPSDPPTPEPPLPGGTAAESSGTGDEPGAGEDSGFAGRGCGCTTSQDPAAPAAALGLLLLGLGLRRRRRFVGAV